VGLSALEAEDLVQDALLKVWRKADSFDAQKATAATWIFTIARNLRIDAARKAARKKPLPEDLWQDSPQTNADQNMISAQEAQKITSLMTILPQEQKDVIKLSFYDEFSHAEIAQRLNVPLGTVKSRLRLALNRLKSAFGPTTVTAKEGGMK
jgi:RNA polymerase sigma-70 factor (ECF subfamily)